MLLICRGDVESNPGPKKQRQTSFCHWNLNGLAAHNFSKVSLLQAISVSKNYDLICLSETFLYPSIDSSDERITIEGYTFSRTDHPSNEKRGGICIYYKEHLPVIKIDDLCNLNGCLVLEIRIGGEKCFFSCLYKSPSQGREEYESFCTDFDSLLSNINDLSLPCSIIIDDFNARSTKWWKLDKENLEGREINIITRAAGYSQLIHQPTNITKDSLSCIDLIFTSNPNLIKSSGVKMSLFEKCQHNIVYDKIDFKIPIPPPYMRDVWDYKNASAECIQRSISSIDWDFLFWRKYMNKQVDILNECLKNIFHNFVPSNVIKCDYRQTPWMTDSIKNKLKERAKLTKKYFKGGKKTPT